MNWQENHDQPLWRRSLPGIAALLVSAGLIAAIAFSLDSSAVRERLGLIPELDVPYVATRRAMVDTMLDMAEIGPQDHVIDLGTGDGRILLAAAQDRGASGLGVDIDPAMIATASAEAARLGLSERVSFREQDLFETPLAEADVVTMFLLPEVNLRLRPRLLEELRPGARVVSHRFDMGEWQADEVRRTSGYPAYLWIVPADVAGRWRLELGGQAIALELAQNFQEVSGTAAIDGEVQRIAPVLRGERLRFSIDLPDGLRNFDATVQGDRMVPSGSGEWVAERIPTE